MSRCPTRWTGTPDPAGSTRGLSSSTVGSRTETRRAYLSSVLRFLDWCEDRELELFRVQPGHFREYLDIVFAESSPATQKRQLSALPLSRVDAPLKRTARRKAQATPSETVEDGGCEAERFRSELEEFRPRGA